MKKAKIIGIPLWLYLILGVILMTAVYMGALPNDFTGAFAVSAILVCMAVVILVLRSVLEHKGKGA